MLLKANSLMKSQVLANDGDVGSLVDIYFDDSRWAARYLVVETGRWMDRKRVLVSPASLHRHSGEIGVVHADLSREQIRNCPDVDSDQPVSRRYEIAHARYYGLAGYWSGSMLWGPVAMPNAAAPMPLPDDPILRPVEADEVREALDDAERTHLRSAKELIGYKVEASDGDAGELDDFAIDDEDWSIPYLIVDAKPWWPGGQVLVRPANIEAIHFDRSRVTVNLTKQALRDAGQG